MTDPEEDQPVEAIPPDSDAPTDAGETAAAEEDDESVIEKAFADLLRVTTPHGTRGRMVTVQIQPMPSMMPRDPILGGVKPIMWQMAFHADSVKDALEAIDQVAEHFGASRL